MKCHHCAANNTDKAAFCKYCGVSLHALGVEHSAALPGTPTVLTGVLARFVVKIIGSIRATPHYSYRSNTTNHFLYFNIVRLRLRHFLVKRQVKLWLMMLASFIVFPLLVASLTSVIIPLVMQYFFSDSVPQPARFPQSVLYQVALQPSFDHMHASTMQPLDQNLLKGHYQLLLFYQKIIERYYFQHGHFPADITDLHRYLSFKTNTVQQQAQIVMDGRGMLVSISGQNSQLKLYAIAQVDNRSIRWQCYTTSTLLTMSDDCILPNK